MTIDMHSHWRPPALIDALRERAETPHVAPAGDGAEVLRMRHADMAMEEAFDDTDRRLADMDEHGVSTAALSLKRVAMLKFAVKLTVTPSAVNDADVEALRSAGFSDRDILDIVEVVGYYAYANRVADGLGLELETWIPD